VAASCAAAALALVALAVLVRRFLAARKRTVAEGSGESPSKPARRGLRGGPLGGGGGGELGRAGSSTPPTPMGSSTAGVPALLFPNPYNPNT